jgi:hypothetical protein
MRNIHKLFLSCACLVTICFWLSGNGNGSNAETTDKNQQQTRASASKSCADMTAEVSAISGRKLRQRPLEIHAPQEGLIRGCTWSEEGGGVNTYEITKEPANKYIEKHEDVFRKASAERFKQLQGFGDKAFLSPTAFEGWTACALRSSDCTCVEISGESTTAEQATKLLRFALDHF